MEYHYKTRGTCSSEIIVELNGNTVKSLRVVGGCDGNSKGIAALARGMDADEVIKRCKGIRCGFKPTSCPDQIAAALTHAKEIQSK